MTHPKQLLHPYQLEPKKSLGQNFLFDENVLARIVTAADVQPDDEVLEIGPGLGTLTRPLARIARRVVAVELDDRLLPILREQLAPFPHTEIIHGDILEQDLSRFFTRPYKVVANVPYYITGRILRYLLDGPQKPTLLVLTVQKEVAERLTAVPPNMSLLAASTQFYGRAQIVTTLKAGSFWPRPDVDSAVIRLDLYPEAERPLPSSEEAPFLHLLKLGFSQKRKQLQNNLQHGLDKTAVAHWLQQANIDGRRRAETLTMAEWLAIYHKRPTPYAQP